MTRTNTARHAGDTYQARMFWINAANLLKATDPIVEVAWENGPKGLDDIRIDYRPPKRSNNGPISRDYVQCKWHVAAGEFGYQNLADPSFVHGTRHSWLSRAYDAFQSDSSKSQRYTLQTNWRINASDPLFELQRKESNELDVAKLFTGTTVRSMMHRVRECWCDHLDIDEDELRDFAAALKIADNVGSMDDLRERLDDRLVAVGLCLVPNSQSAYVYDDLVIKLHGEGDVVLDDERLREICDRENLWEQDAPKSSSPFTLGIRSFMHKYDDMEHRCDSLLDFVPYFEGRYLRSAKDWSVDLFPELRDFIQTHAREHQNLRVRIDAHASIAFVTGRLLDVKSGVATEIEQRTSGAGLQYWRADNAQHGPTLDVHASGGDGADLVVALSITHDVLSNVNVYCERELPSDHRLLDARLSSGPSGLGVVDGAHAWQIAESIAAAIREQGGHNRPRVHLFAAAPNAVIFFIGQQLGLGDVVAYEYDFEGARGGGYHEFWTLNEF